MLPIRRSLVKSMISSMENFFPSVIHCLYIEKVVDWTNAIRKLYLYSHITDFSHVADIILFIIRCLIYSLIVIFP